MRDEPPGTAPRMRPSITPSRRVRITGLPRTVWGDAYHRALLMRWRVFLPVVALGYLSLNLPFALLYMLDAGGITMMRPGSFADAFFFSVQTLATIGYGRLAPVDTWSNLVVTAETLVGLASVALVTGLGFARFSRPTARVAFTRNVVVEPYDGLPTLMVRLGNQRRSQILEAGVTISLLRDELSHEGIAMRRFYTLPLVRAHSPVFTLTFTAMHVLDASSPLHGATPTSLRAMRAELLVTVTGLEETLLQTVHARHSYRPEDLVWGNGFADMLLLQADGSRVLDFTRFDLLRE